MLKVNRWVIAQSFIVVLITGHGQISNAKTENLYTSKPVLSLTAAKKAADKVALRTDATALFNSEGLENSPFSYASDIRSGQPQINQSWRGYKGQGEVQAVNFTNDGNFYEYL